jgi:hypothetical protein
MVQVGTNAFDAAAWCHPSTVTLTGTMLAMDAPQAIMDFSDGYMATIAVTAGADVFEEGNIGSCIAGEGTGAACVMANGGDEPATMAANSLVSRMFAAGTFVMEGDNDLTKAVALPAGAAAVLAPAGVNNGVAPEATPEQIENEEAPEAPEGEQLYDGLKTGATFSVTYYQPKGAATYAGLWRFQAGETVMGFQRGPDAETANTFKKCETAILTGANAIVAGAAIAFGAAALF